MDVTRIYFSQTGNTRKITNVMAGGFREAGHAVWASIRLGSSTWDIRLAGRFTVGA
ncbi:MAG: hypothetical protein M1379_07785 [Firmicutes bacterium]|nr:hypothetical protein [Bacillota bacterium]